MSERNGYQPGVPAWVDTWQPDASAAGRFYGELFGWEVLDPPPSDGDHRRYVMCRLRGIGEPMSKGAVPAWTVYVQVESADAAAAHVVAAGGRVVAEPFDSLEGGRIAIVADPVGAIFGIWQPGEHEGAQLVNEPSAWSISVLVSPDPERAKPFYREVFGWDSEEFGPPGGGLSVFRLPGFVGGEPQQPVARDVVAAMIQAHGEDQTPAWAVDFWVGDAEAAAAKVVELGGAVLTGPYDTPNGKQAVVADPAGAVFTVSRVTAAA
jgi:hypothetical protein